LPSSVTYTNQSVNVYPVKDHDKDGIFIMFTNTYRKSSVFVSRVDNELEMQHWLSWFPNAIVVFENVHAGEISIVYSHHSYWISFFDFSTSSIQPHHYLYATNTPMDPSSYISMGSLWPSQDASHWMEPGWGLPYGAYLFGVNETFIQYSVSLFVPYRSFMLQYRR